MYNQIISFEFLMEHVLETFFNDMWRLQSGGKG